MPEKEKRAQLSDILTYTPEAYFDEGELSLIRSYFAGENGKKLIRILRKVLLPTVSDPSLPIEEAGSDAWMSGIDFRQIPEAEVKSVVLGRQEAIKFVIGGLVKLKMMAVPEESELNRAARRAKDSTQ